jgi:hypothetical protein
VSTLGSVDENFYPGWGTKRFLSGLNEAGKCIPSCSQRLCSAAQRGVDAASPASAAYPAVLFDAPRGVVGKDYFGRSPWRERRR